jgi:hypothetical protein
MRYTVFFSLLLSIACSKSESPSPPAGEARPELATDTERAAVGQRDTSQDVQAPPALAPPSIELVSAGEPPRQTLRWDLQKGAKETVRIGIKSAAAPGGRELFLLPAVGYELTVVSKEVTPKGMVRVEFRVDDILYPEVSPNLSAQGVEALKKSLGPVQGKTGGYFIDPRGVVSDVHLDPKGQGDEKIERRLRKLLHWTTVPVPEEEVGLGGSWTVTRVTEEEGVRVQEVLTAELTKMEASRIDVSLKIDGTAPRQVLTQGPGVPPGGSLTVLRRETRGIGGGAYDLTRLVPQLVKIESATEMISRDAATEKASVIRGANIITTTRK